MGSIIMHLCIANEVNKELKLDNKEFMLGNMEPDVDKLNSHSTINTHYIKKYKIQNKIYELPDLVEFIKENKVKLKNDNLLLGYLSHLIADKYWYIMITDKYEKMHIQKNITYKKFKDLLYEDYNNTNNYLIKKYNIELDKVCNLIKNDKKYECVKEFLINDKEYKNEIELNIMNLEDILNWIEKSKQEIVKQISKILEEKL